ncbi:MAG: hypothetical protein HY661_07635 [Betaproteobacteria bacterium]|nr:hypothetical protein [Betaproteobacteria bacterium]
MAQIIVSAAGAVAGSFIPGVGPAMGWSIGAALGGMMFPQKSPTVSQGSTPLMDLRVTGTEYGQPIPYVRGAAGIAGQMWWNTDRRPTTTVTSSGGGGGGKGGGGGGSPVVETSTTTYDMDCLIGLTDNEIIGIARIWSNGALIYTADSGATAGSILASEVSNAWTRMTVYTGAADQLPDPTYEAAVGVGAAPAYRGRGTVFIEGLKLGQNGQVPNLTFEVVADGTTVLFPQEGLVLWLDGADADTFTLTGALVEQWNDKSGEGNHHTQSGAALHDRRPTKSGNGVIFTANALPNDDVKGLVAASAIIASGAISYYLVWKRDLQRNDVVLHQDGNVYAYLQYSSNWYFADSPLAVAFANDVVAIKSARSDGATEVARATNGVEHASQAFSGSPVVRAIGAMNTYPAGLDGTIYELLVYDVRLGDADNTAVINYLEGKWGIA